MWIHRSITPVIRRALAQFPAVVLTGARQVGKTSLTRHLLPKGDYITFDLPAEAELARLDPEGFFGRHREPLILDEVQYVPEIFRSLKRYIDADRRPGRYLLTGSQDFLLMARITESLAGRIAVLTLPSLEMEEALGEKARIEDVDRFLWRGGFPELWQRPELDQELWFGSYLTTYLERDVRNLSNVGNLRNFDRFLRAIALRVGQLLSMAEVARDVGVSPNTIKNWISILQASQQIFLLEPYHTNRGKRLIKTPKIYFSDTGLLALLLGFRQLKELMGSPLWGQMWENLVVMETRKKFLNLGKRPALYFWRTANGEEIDLLVERAVDRYWGIECKTAAEVSSSALKGVRSFRQTYGDHVMKHASVICRTRQVYPLSKGERDLALPLAGPDGALELLAKHITT